MTFGQYIAIAVMIIGAMFVLWILFGEHEKDR